MTSHIDLVSGGEDTVTPRKVRGRGIRLSCRWASQSVTAS